jgi:tetratricopeptide (TPR) repeat protein
MSASPETTPARTGGAGRRAVLYGTALVLAGGLVYGGFVFEAQPDVLTVLGNVDMALKVAHTLPEFDKTGKRLAYRDGEIARAEALLRGIEEREPGLAITIEMQAFARFLRGDWAEAAGLYRRSLSGKEADLSRRTNILLNVAEMEIGAGNTAGALEALDRIADQPGFRIQAATCRARALQKAGRTEEAVAALHSVASVTTEDPVQLLECGRLLGELGDTETAVAVIEAAVPGTGEVGLYYLARLKFKAGESDMALTALVKAHQTGPGFVNDALRRDREIWEPLRTDPRLERLLGESARETAAPGR